MHDYKDNTENYLTCALSDQYQQTFCGKTCKLCVTSSSTDIPPANRDSQCNKTRNNIAIQILIQTYGHLIYITCFRADEHQLLQHNAFS